MIDSAAGETIAAPRPWTARAAISQASDCARPPSQRGEREHDQAEHEHPAAAEQVGHPPAEQQKAAERQRVGVHDPGEVVREKCRCAPIDGSATLTIDASITITNCVIASSAARGSSHVV